MTRRQRKIREVRMFLWKILREWKLLIGIILLIVTLIANSAIIAAVLVFGSDALWHFTHGAEDKSNWIFGITLLTILSEIAFFSWYYGDEEDSKHGNL